MRTTQQELFLHSAVKSSLLEHYLFKGSCIAFLGIALLFFSYYHILPLSLGWSQALSWSGFTIIALGMLPYKKLSRLETHPHLLHVNTKELHLFCRKKLALALSLDRIRKISYIDEGKVSGIAIHVDHEYFRTLALPHDMQRITRHISNLRQKHQGLQRSLCGEMIVIPHFTERSAKELHRYVDTIQTLASTENPSFSHGIDL